jgi:hypothetical protein
MPRPLNYTKPDIQGYKVMVGLGQVPPMSVFDPSQLPQIPIGAPMVGPVGSVLTPVIQSPQPLPVYHQTVSDWLTANWQLLALGGILGLFVFGHLGSPRR